MTRKRTLACLTGAGTAPELMAEALYALGAVAQVHRFEFEQTHAWFGSAARVRSGQTVPAATRDAVRGADAVMVAGAEEPALADIMAELDLRARLTRVLAGRREDLAFVTALDDESCEWAIRRAFQLAERRAYRLACVGDGAWREQVELVAREYEHVHVEHVPPRNAMPLAAFDPGRFDVVAVAPVWAEGIVEIAAASAEHRVAAHALLAEHGPSLFVPAPDRGFALAGHGDVNSSGMLLCAALTLEHGLAEPPAAMTLAGAVSAALADGPARTGLLRPVISTHEFTQRVLACFQLSIRNAEFWPETASP